MAGGPYVVTVRINGSPNCAASGQTTLTAPEAPVVSSIVPSDPTDCGLNDGSIIITATGNNLQYSIDNGATFQASGNFSGLSEGTYNVVVRSNGLGNCVVTSTEELTLTDTTAPVISCPANIVTASLGW